MITSQGGYDLAPPGVCPRHLKCQIYGLSSSNAEYREIQIGGHQFRDQSCQVGPLLTDQVVIAHIYLCQAFSKQVDQFTVPMSQIEYTPVTVEVEQPLVTIHIPQIRPFPPAHHKIHTVFPEKGRLP